MDLPNEPNRFNPRNLQNPRNLADQVSNQALSQQLISVVPTLLCKVGGDKLSGQSG